MPAGDKAGWTQVQKALTYRLKELGADKHVASDEAEVTLFYGIKQLEELATAEADKLIRRLTELRRAN